MSELTKQVHRFYARALIMLIYILLSVFLFKELNAITSKAMLLSVINIQENLLFFWAASLILLSLILDFIFPKRTVKWCLIDNNQIMLRRSIIQWLKLNIDDIDQIRVAKESFFNSPNPSLFIFLKSGKYKQITGEKQGNLNRLVNFIQENTSGIDVKEYEN